LISILNNKKPLRNVPLDINISFSLVTIL
jgi:hypothetical protein